MPTNSSKGPFNIFLGIIWDIFNINLRELLMVIDYVYYEQVERCNREYPSKTEDLDRCKTCGKPPRDRINGTLSCQFIYEHGKYIDATKLYKWKSTVCPTENEMVAFLERCLFAYIDGVDGKGDRRANIDTFGCIENIKCDVEKRIINSDMEDDAKKHLIEWLDKGKWDKGKILDEKEVYKYTRNMIDIQLMHSWNLQRLSL